MLANEVLIFEVWSEKFVVFSWKLFLCSLGVNTIEVMRCPLNMTRTYSCHRNSTQGKILVIIDVPLAMFFYGH